MKDSILVSIIVPIYNVSKYIKSCAQALFTQSYKNCEFIFVNDCTPDNSIVLLREVINHYPDLADRVFIVNHPENKGLACARNTGVQAANGEYVMHVDSDDTIESNTVEECVKMVKTTGADAVIFGMKHIMKQGARIEHIKIPKDHSSYIKELITRNTIVCMCGGLYKRSLYIDNNIWAIPDLNMGEDYSTKPRLLYYAKKIVALDLPLYLYNHLNDNSYTQKFNTDCIDNITKAINVLTDFFNKCNDGYLYEESLKIAALSSKVLLLKSWAISHSTRQDFQKINALYPSIEIKYISSRIDRLLLHLSGMNADSIVALIVKLGFKTKSLLK